MCKRAQIPLTGVNTGAGWNQEPDRSWTVRPAVHPSSILSCACHCKPRVVRVGVSQRPTDYTSTRHIVIPQPRPTPSSRLRAPTRRSICMRRRRRRRRRLDQLGCCGAGVADRCYLSRAGTSGGPPATCQLANCIGDHDHDDDERWAGRAWLGRPSHPIAVVETRVRAR